MQAYQKVLKARELTRISSLELIHALCSEFMELHGDRLMEDDQAIVAGIGQIENQAITIVGIQKGHNLKTNMLRNFGSVRPSGYRKAQRIMRQAEKFGRPVLTLINTAGAYCAPESEEKGIGEAIAQTLMTMSQLTVPTLAIILGEGGSGGAIALALTDEVWMLENSVYAILSPEGFASILWKNSKFASKAADYMKLTAEDLLELKVIDRIIAEVDEKGEMIDKESLIHHLVQEIKDKLHQLSIADPDLRLEKKYQRFRQY